MQPLLKRAGELKTSIDEAFLQLNIAAKTEELAHIDEQLAESDVWSNLERAQMLSKQAASLRRRSNRGKHFARRVPIYKS